MAFLQSLFGNARGRAHQRGTGAAPPPALLARHILSLTLTRVSDIFDADGLWSAQHTKKSAIREKASGNSRHRLYAHLKANKRKVHRQDPGSGRLLGLRRVYSDIVVQINPQLWITEIRSGEPGFAILTTNLAQRHRKDFKRDLKALGRMPRYVVAPAADLAVDEVRFLFGNGIFVPDENDELLMRLSLLGPAGERLEVRDWEIYDHAGNMLRRPAGLYADQRSCCIRGPAGPSLVPLVARGWPRDNIGFAQLSRSPAAGHWRAYDDGETCRCKDADGEPFASGRRYRFVDTSGREALSLLLEPIGTDSAAPDSEPTSSTPEIAPGQSATPSTVGERPSYVLRLAGIALPRIDGPRQIRLGGGVGLDGWRLWLDAQGGPADLGQADPSALAMLTAEAATGRLLARHAGTADQVEIGSLPFQLRTNPSDVSDQTTVSPPVHENHLGLVWLLQQPELALAYVDCPVPGPRWLGRAGGLSTSELCLDFFDQPGSLLWSRPGVSSGSLAQFELSRQQLEAVLDPPSNRLDVTPPASGSPVSSFVLDPGLRLLTTLKPGDATWHLELGQYLLLGCHLLRFERIESATEAVGDKTIFAGSPTGNEDDRIVITQRQPRAD